MNGITIGLFTSPDSKLEVEVAYTGGEADSYDADIISWGIEYEYRFANWDGNDGGMSGFIAYKGNYVEHDVTRTTTTVLWPASSSI